MKKLIFALTLLCCTTAYASDDAVPFKAAIHTEPIPIDSCGPTCVLLSITGTGRGSHFGRMTIAGPSQIDFATGAQTGTSTLTAADGSTLVIVFEGVFVSGPGPTDPVFFQGDWIVDSGTGSVGVGRGSGRFE